MSGDSLRILDITIELGHLINGASITLPVRVERISAGPTAITSQRFLNFTGGEVKRQEGSGSFRTEDFLDELNNEDANHRGES